jgi:hypothetical protein
MPFLSIQKHYRHFKMDNSFADAMKPGKFAGANFRRWATKLDLSEISNTMGITCRTDLWQGALFPSYLRHGGDLPHL